MSNSYEIVDCPVCGSGGSRPVAGVDEIHAEVADLWEFHTDRMRPTSDTRQLLDRVAFSQAPPIRVAQCTMCTHLFRNPREKRIDAIYGGEDVGDDALEALFVAQKPTFRKQIARLRKHYAGHGNGLEVGSYVGAFLAAARDAGLQFDGVDVNPTAVAFARQKGFQVVEGAIEDTDAARKYGVIAFWNCFEQLPDAAAAARAAYERLHDNGIMTVRVPNGGYWLALRETAAGSGPLAGVARAALAQNNLLSFPYRNGFTSASLTRLAQNTGFVVESIASEFSLPAGSAGTPRWARMEARAVHTLVRALKRITGAPWLEMYARKRAPTP